MKQYKDAETAQKRAIYFGEKLGDPTAILSRYIQLGEIYQRLCKFHEALDEYKKVIKIARKARNTYYLSLCLYNYATLKVETDMPDGAENLLHEALDIAEHSKYPDIVAMCLCSLGKLHISEGNLHTANEMLVKAEAHVVGLTNFDLINRIYIQLAKIATRKGDWSLAIQHYNKLIEFVYGERAKIYPKLDESRFVLAAGKTHAGIHELLPT